MKVHFEDLQHDHMFLGDQHHRNERKVWWVIALTASMMVLEIAAGSLFGSMALLADGWHMSTHAGAMLIAALAYWYARREAKSGRFTFGTGKLGDLAGFASAVILALIALLIAAESFVRLANPVAIEFNQSILVAVLGLGVNLLSAWLLREEPHHHGGHHAHHSGHHAHHGGHHHQGQDHNLRAAYLHVLADALTSVLAIAALLLGRSYGWVWLDPLMGIVGGAVIARWSYGLIRDTAGVLLDAVPANGRLMQDIRERIETGGDRLADLHVWQIGPGHHAAILSVVSSHPEQPASYKAKLAGMKRLSHITVEVSQAA